MDFVGSRIFENLSHSMITIQSYVKLTDSECDDNVRLKHILKDKKACP